MRSVVSLTQRKCSVLAVCLCLSSGLLCAQQGVIPKQVQEWQQAAAEAVQQNDVDIAANFYGQIIQHYPQTRYAIEAHRETAAAHIQAQQYEVAKTRIEALKNEYADHPDFAESLHWIAIRYGWNDRWDEAIQLHRYNVVTNPLCKKAMWSQVEIIYDHIRRNDWAGAQAAQAEMLTRFSEQPTLSKEIWQIADRYLHAGQHEQAQELCSYGMRAYPDGPWMGDYNIIQVEIHLAKGDVSQANASLDSFWTMHAEQEGIVELLTAIKTEYWLKGHHNASQALCERIIAAYPDDPTTASVLSDYICGQIALGRDTDVWQDVEAFWQRYQAHPEFVEMVHRIAHHYLHQSGDVGRSLELNLRLLNEYPRHEAALKIERDMAIAYLDRGAKEMADARLKSLLTTYADHPSLPEALNGMGDAYRRHGNYADAIQVHQTALAFSPTETELLCAYAGMAKAQIQKGGVASDPNEVKSARGDEICPEIIIEQLVTDYPNADRTGFHVFQIAEEYYFLGERLMRDGHREQGKQAFETAIRLWENNRVLSDRRHAAMAAYFSAVASGYIDDDASALMFYQEVGQVYPEYERAWHARFMIAEQAGKLDALGQINRTDAVAMQWTAYQDLLDNDPNSPVDSIVRQRVQMLSR